MWRNGTSLRASKNCLKERIGNQGQKVDLFTTTANYNLRYHNSGHFLLKKFENCKMEKNQIFVEKKPKYPDNVRKTQIW